MGKKAKKVELTVDVQSVAGGRARRSVLLDTRVVCCGDNLGQSAKLSDGSH